MSIETYKEEYKKAFVPAEYLTTYYTNGPDKEADFIISFITRIQQALALESLKVLEFGGGPALYNIPAYVPFAREIHFADYLPANVETVSRWVDCAEDAFDWSAYIKLALINERIAPTPAAIIERTMAMRRLITHITECNALSPLPVPGCIEPYDFVSALYCTDIAASNTEEWYVIMQNLSRIVKPGGYLMLGLTQGVNENVFRYDANGRAFPYSDLSDTEILHGYALAGFDLSTFHKEKRKALPIRDYHYVLMMIARKHDNKDKLQ